MSVQTDSLAKASYTRRAGRALRKYAWRKRDLDSEIGNATAIGRLTHSLTLVGLGEAFDQAWDAAERQLRALRRATAIDWRQNKGDMDASLARVEESLNELEKHLGEHGAQNRVRRIEWSDN